MTRGLGATSSGGRFTFGILRLICRLICRPIVGCFLPGWWRRRRRRVEGSVEVLQGPPGGRIGDALGGRWAGGGAMRPWRRLLAHLLEERDELLIGAARLGPAPPLPGPAPLLFEARLGARPQVPLGRLPAAAWLSHLRGSVAVIPAGTPFEAAAMRGKEAGSRAPPHPVSLAVAVAVAAWRASNGRDVPLQALRAALGGQGRGRTRPTSLPLGHIISSPPPNCSTSGAPSGPIDRCIRLRCIPVY